MSNKKKPYITRTVPFDVIDRFNEDTALKAFNFESLSLIFDDFIKVKSGKGRAKWANKKFYYFFQRDLNRILPRHLEMFYEYKDFEDIIPENKEQYDESFEVFKSKIKKIIAQRVNESSLFLNEFSDWERAKEEEKQREGTNLDFSHYIAKAVDERKTAENKLKVGFKELDKIWADLDRFKKKRDGGWIRKIIKKTFNKD